MRGAVYGYERWCVGLRKAEVLNTLEMRCDTLQMRDLCNTMRNHSIFEV